MKIKSSDKLITGIINLSRRLDNNLRKIFVILKYLLLLFFAMNLMIGCSKVTEVKPEQFEQIFGKSNKIENKIPAQINIIIDRSASIQGFVSTPNNQFIRTIQDFIQNVPKNIPIQIFELDATIKPISSNLLNALNQIVNAAFFNGSQTNISAILSLPEVQNKNNLTLIFSDWIHSLKKDVIANQMIIFSRDLKEFIKDEGLFAMFGKEALFNGTYYVECKPPSTLDFNNETKLRPYFCIVLGSNKHSDFLLKYIQPFYNEELVLGVQEKIQSEFKPLSEYEDWTDPLDSTNTVRIRLLDADSISFSLTLKEDLQFDQKLIPSIEAYFVRFDADTITEKKLITDSSIRLDSTKKLQVGQEYFITLFLSKFDEQKILAKISFFQDMPDWIKSWSTDCDNNLNNAQKVYQLNRWINDYIYNDLDTKHKTTFTKYLYIWR